MFEDKIVAAINTTLETEFAANACLSNNKLWAIAEPILTIDADKKESIAPGVINLDGEVTYTAHDDIYSITAYHKLVTVNYSNVEGQSYGDKKQDFINGTAELDLIVTASRTRTKMNPRQLADTFLSWFPASQIKITDTSNNKVATASLSVTSINYDSIALFGRDYRGTQNFITPDLMLFGIRYRIESIFRKECFNTCIC